MSRIKKFREKLSFKGIGAILVTDMKDIRYLSGFTGSTAFMIITPGEARFFTDGRYIAQAEEEVSPEIERVILSRYSVLFAEECPKYKKITLQSAASLETEALVKDAGVEISVERENILLKMRAIKEHDEIEAVKEEYRLAASAFKKSLPSFRAGIPEKHWAAVLEYNMKLAGADGPGFDTIVASGFRSCLPHGAASMKIVDKKDPVILDFGSIENYNSDYTRMFYTGNDREVLNIINILENAVKFAIDGVKRGTKCSDIDKIARDYIDSKGFGEYFTHSLGHGVGLNVHELPVLNSSSRDVCEEGMIFTVEPGIYIPGKYGARLEDTVLVKDGGGEVISGYLDKYVYGFD